MPASRKKLAIVGLGRGKDDAPKPDGDWEVWRINPGFWIAHDTVDALLDTSAWFEIHTRRYLTQAHGTAYCTRIVKMLKVTRTPLWVLEPREWKDVSSRLLFPRALIAKEFPRGDYHAGSCDWLVAFALTLDYKHIELFGIDLGPTDTGEPISARPCLEYWCGVAAGRGVTVVSHSPSLFKIFNYQRATTPYHYDPSWRLIEDRK